MFFRPIGLLIEKLVTDDTTTMGWVGFMALPATLFTISLLITVIVGGAAILASAFLSRLLDWVTWRQIRTSACGGDCPGELPSEVRDNPLWLKTGFGALPDALGEEIAAFSNLAAAGSVARLRSVMRDLAFGADSEGSTVKFSDYLTWKELIHTCYFEVPRFRMLVAYAIAHSPGFRPSAAFESHPDYRLVARWHAELQPKPAVKGRTAAKA
jgi:hypothetical protein